MGVELWARVAAVRAAGGEVAVCTVVDTGGSTPRKAGSKMLVFPDGSQEGTIGGGAIELEVVREAREALSLGEGRLVVRHLTHELGMCCGGGMKVFVEVVRPGPRCYVFGCGHVGAEVARLAAHVGFEVVAVDARPEMMVWERFGGQVQEGLRLRCEGPLEALEALPFDGEGPYVVVVTHDHALDEALVGAALRRPTRYLGCIGSVRKGLRFRERLVAGGLEAGQVARLRTPMGLDIEAQTPEEIAVSVVAELIGVRRAGHPRGGRDGAGA
jgi:xanthine dehydrogenase accessory factor